MKDEKGLKCIEYLARMECTRVNTKMFYNKQQFSLQDI